MTDETAILEILRAMQTDLAALKSKVDALPDLRFIQDLAHRAQRDMMQFRDDMRVQTAIIMRLDTSHGLLLEEVRSVHAQIGRMNDRIRSLEDASPL